MTPVRKRRLTIVLLALTGLGTATAIVLTALNDNLLFFQSPSDIYARSTDEGLSVKQSFRLGGLVQIDSVERDQTSLAASFKVTDGKHSLPVHFDGILPDLFQEGQGVIAIGKLGNDCEFYAEQVLAKHDETYMPREVADALDTADRNPGYNPGSAAGQKAEREQIASTEANQLPLRFDQSDNACKV